jgi:hypothetical protein
MDLREIGWRDVDWIRLVQDRDQFGFHKMLGILGVAEQLVASQQGLSSMELDS